MRLIYRGLSIARNRLHLVQLRRMLLLLLLLLLYLMRHITPRHLLMLPILAVLPARIPQTLAHATNFLAQNLSDLLNILGYRHLITLAGCR